MAKPPAPTKHNWARIGNDWLSLDTLPSKGPVVLANDDLTVVWCVDRPATDAVQHVTHKRGDDGHFEYDKDKEPVTESADVKPAFWSPAAYVDAQGERI